MLNELLCKKLANLILTPPEDYPIVTTELIKYLTPCMKGVYVTTNKPFIALRDMLEKEGVDIKNLVFIDCISRAITNSLIELREVSLCNDEPSNCFFIKTPENLTDISIGIIEAIDDADFLFFDSISTLLLYNDAKNVTRFAHFLIGKMRIKKIITIFIIVDNPEEKGFICHISQFFDNVLKIKLRKKWNTKIQKRRLGEVIKNLINSEEEE